MNTCIKYLLICLSVISMIVGCPSNVVKEDSGEGAPEPQKPLCDADSLQIDFTALIENLRREAEPASPGLSVALVYPKGVDYEVVEVAAGLSSLENPTFLISKDVFQMGAITEAFIAAGILLLQEQGKVLLEGTISQYLDEVAYASLGNVGGLTLRNLALKETDLVGYYDVGMPVDPTPSDRIAFFRTALENIEESAEQIRLDYVILGMIIEQVTQLTSWRSLGSWLLDNVGLATMGKTGFPTSDQYTVVNGYQATAGELDQILHHIDKPGSYYWADRNLVTNVTELAEWYYWLNSGEDILKESSRNEMFTFKDSIGLGSRSYDLETKMPGELYGMHGTLPGYLGMVGYWPEAQVSMAVALNQTGVLQVQEVFEKAIELFLDNSDCRQLPY